MKTHIQYVPFSYRVKDSRPHHLIVVIKIRPPAGRFQKKRSSHSVANNEAIHRNQYDRDHSIYLIEDSHTSVCLMIRVVINLLVNQRFFLHKRMVIGTHPYYRAHRSFSSRLFSIGPSYRLTPITVTHLVISPWVVVMSPHPPDLQC